MLGVPKREGSFEVHLAAKRGKKHFAASEASGKNTKDVHVPWSLESLRVGPAVPKTGKSLGTLSKGLLSRNES